jgi:hypothetical protein
MLGISLERERNLSFVDLRCVYMLLIVQSVLQIVYVELNILSHVYLSSGSVKKSLYRSTIIYFRRLKT